MEIPRLTAIGRPGMEGAPAFEAWVERLCGAGVDAIQVRDKRASDLDLFETVQLTVELAAGRTRVLVNGRADVALATGADGVHLPADGAPVEAIRGWMGSARLVGRSAHSEAEIDAAGEAGADYVYFSPVFESPGKTPVGLARLARAAARGVPVIALGGIRIDRLQAVAEAGAVGVAGIRMFADPARASDLVAAARRLFPRS